jgi:hypothetical protein
MFFDLEFFTPEGTAIVEHVSPLTICLRPTEAILAAAGGDLRRTGVFRYDPAERRFHRLPLAAPDQGSAGDQRPCVQTTQSGTFAMAVLPAGATADTMADPRYFPETGFRIADDGMWQYFQHRGGLRAFGYPVSRPFLLFGTEVQFFQRRVLQRMPDGTIQQLNLMSPEIFPFRHVNGSTFPPPDEAMVTTAPIPGTEGYADAALAFVRRHAILDFGRAYFSTITCADAFPGEVCSQGIVDLLNLELWGLPVSPPAIDPNNFAFAYQVYQRGILQHNFETGVTEGILLADWIKALITGEGLPPDLDAEAAGAPLWRQYDPANVVDGLNRPGDLPATSMTAAFAPDVPREIWSSEALFGETVAFAPERDVAADSTPGPSQGVAGAPAAPASGAADLAAPAVADGSAPAVARVVSQPEDE